MASATLTGEVLSRRAQSFKNDDGETVTYYESIVYDPTTKDLTIVRSSDATDLDALGAGESVKGLAVEVRGPGRIRANLVRPLRENRDSGDF